MNGTSLAEQYRRQRLAEKQQASDVRRMASITKTGNSEIDKQHSIMHDCLADLASHCAGNSDPAALLGALDILFGYAEWHFTFEERLLERAKYPHLEAHVAEHRAIIGQLENLRGKLASGNKDAARLIAMINHWIIDHVNHEDGKSAAYLGDGQPGVRSSSRLPSGGVPRL